MKQFIKMTLATLTGLLLFGFVSILLISGIIGAIATIGQGKAVMPEEAVLTIDFSKMTISEQTKEVDALTSLKGGEIITPLGIYSAIKAVNAAAEDPAVKFIFMKPDAATGGNAQLEEFRTALKNFKDSGKAIVSYIENPTNAGYYLASVSDKIYMTNYDGGTNMFNGISSQLTFLKDALDRLGVNVQLIRHGKYKSAGETFIRNSSSKENLEQNEALINSIWESWASDIAESREISVEELNDMLNNLKLNFPEDFLANGLVDELLTRNELQEKLATLFVADDYEDVKSISLSDYAVLKDTPAINTSGKVAVIYAEGNIVDGEGNEQIAGDRFAELVETVRNDDDIKAVVLRVNSPGGSVLASEKIKAELDLLQEKGIPVIASYGDYAASGGYWISANADYIFANRTTLTGSIGVFSMIPDFGAVIENKLHVNITQVKSNKHADLYKLMRPLTKDEIAYMQANVEKIYGKFTSIVAEGRDMTVENVDAIAQGRVWSGAEALDINLVDEIGTIEDAILYAAMTIDGVSGIQDVEVVSYPKPETKIEALLKTFGGASIFAGTPFEDLYEAFGDWNWSESGQVYARMPYDFIIR